MGSCIEVVGRRVAEELGRRFVALVRGMAARRRAVEERMGRRMRVGVVVAVVAVAVGGMGLARS
jgi:hypothetical protein